jgi:uncharacterized membrane protein
MNAMTTRTSRVGVALVAVGLSVNPWLLGAALTDDGSISSPELAAGILCVSAALVLAGLQLAFRWADSLAWRQPASARARVTIVTLLALTIAGVQWRLSTYAERHSHLTIVGAGNDQATPEQQQWADRFHQRALDIAMRRGWFDYDTAMRQGFQPDRINHTHFPNLENMFDDVILDPERPEWLIYDPTPDGKVLMGMMFFTRRPDEVGPTPAGPLAQWHYHPYPRPRCAVQGLWTVGRPDENGKCAEGIPVNRTPEMFHVWFIDHPLGRFTEMKIVPEYTDDRGFDVARLHPISVHFAIALFLIAVAFDVAGVVGRKPEYHWAAWLNLALAAVAVVTAVAAGMTAEIALKPTHEAHRTLDVHKQFGLASLAVVGVLAGWRYALRGRFPQKAAAVYLLLSVSGAAMIGAAGYYGGEMVYTHGAGVTAIDRFARDRYWQAVRDVYRRPIGGPFDLAGEEPPPAAPPRPPAHAGH